MAEVEMWNLLEELRQARRNWKRELINVKRLAKIAKDNRKHAQIMEDLRARLAKYPTEKDVLNWVAGEAGRKFGLRGTETVRLAHKEVRQRSGVAGLTYYRFETDFLKAIGLDI